MTELNNAQAVDENRLAQIKAERVLSSGVGTPGTSPKPVAEKSEGLSGQNVVEDPTTKVGEVKARKESSEVQGRG